MCFPPVTESRKNKQNYHFNDETSKKIDKFIIFDVSKFQQFVCDLA